MLEPLAKFLGSLEVFCIDESPRRQETVVLPSSPSHGDDALVRRRPEHLEELLRDIVLADRVLKRQVEPVL